MRFILSGFEKAGCDAARARAARAASDEGEGEGGEDEEDMMSVEDEEEAEEAFSECPQVLEFNFHLATLYKEFLLYI